MNFLLLNFAFVIKYFWIQIYEMIHIFFWWHVIGSLVSFIKAILVGHVINQGRQIYNGGHACLTKENDLGLQQSAMELLQIATA